MAESIGNSFETRPSWKLGCVALQLGGRLSIFAGAGATTADERRPRRRSAAAGPSGRVQARLRAFQTSSHGQRRAHSRLTIPSNGGIGVAPAGGRSSSRSSTSNPLARSRRIQSP